MIETVKSYICDVLFPDYGWGEKSGLCLSYSSSRESWIFGNVVCSVIYYDSLFIHHRKLFKSVILYLRIGNQALSISDNNVDVSSSLITAAITMIWILGRSWYITLSTREPRRYIINHTSEIFVKYKAV